MFQVKLLRGLRNLEIKKFNCLAITKIVLTIISFTHKKKFS